MIQQDECWLRVVFSSSDLAIAADSLLPEPVVKLDASRIESERWIYQVDEPVETRTFTAGDAFVRVEAITEEWGIRFARSYLPRHEPEISARRDESSIFIARELATSVARLACCLVIATHWPQDNNEQVVEPVSALLAAAGWSDDDVRTIATAAAFLAGFDLPTMERLADHAVSVATSTIGNRNGDAVAALADVIGAQAAAQFAEWLVLTAPPVPVNGGVLRQSGSLSGIQIQTLADVTPEPVQWLWPGRIPLGKIAIVAGDPGTGKSTLMTDLAARVTVGMEMPDGTPSDLTGPADVLYISYEDNIADTIVNRAQAAGADLHRFHAAATAVTADGDERSISLPGDLRNIERLVIDHSVALVIIDPVMAAFAANIDSNKDQRVRQVMTPLKAIAESSGASIVLLQHLNKEQDKKAIYRGGGSIGIVGASRITLLASKLENDEHQRVLAVVKSNLAREAPAMAYRIESLSDGSAAVVWDGELDLTADDVLSTVDGRSAGDFRNPREAASDFLAKLLRDGPLESAVVMRAATAAGHTGRTLERAKVDVGIRSYKEGFGPASCWFWTLPEVAAAVSAES